jgi:hypothetical protein
MKSITQLIRYLIYLLIPFSFVACSEDPEPKTVPEGKIAATIDGVYYEADAEATLYGNGEFRLSSKSGNARLFVSMSHAPVVGTYELKGAAIGPPAQEWISYIPNGSLIFYSSETDPGLVVGTLTISEIDETNKTISGTFSSKLFHGDLVSEVTSGEFNKVPYEIIPPNTMKGKN